MMKSFGKDIFLCGLKMSHYTFIMSHWMICRSSQKLPGPCGWVCTGWEVMLASPWPVCPVDGLQDTEHWEPRLVYEQSEGRVQECCLDTSSFLIYPPENNSESQYPTTKTEHNSAPAGCDGDKAMQQKLSKRTLCQQQPQASRTAIWGIKWAY